MRNQNCYFHKQNPITTFCTVKSCTLPMCQECLPIHLQEHEQNYSQPSVLPYEEALKTAITRLQSGLEVHKKKKQQTIKSLEMEEKAIIQSINKYFESMKNKVEKQYESISDAQKRLNKLKKGSLKTLIYYYSGDINLYVNEFELPNFPDFRKNFERLLNKQNEISSHEQQRISTHKKNFSDGPVQNVYERVNKTSENYQKNVFKDYNEKFQQNLQVRNRLIEKQNKPYEEQRKKSHHERTSIFNKRSEVGRNRLYTVQALDHKQENKRENVSSKAIFQERNKMYGEETFQRNQKAGYSNEGFCYQNQESPISFEQRYQKMAEIKYTRKPEMEEKYHYSPLKVSDLEGENHAIRNTKYERTNYYDKNYHEEKKYDYKVEVNYENRNSYEKVDEFRNMRSYSQNNFKNEIKKESVNEDSFPLNNEVMSPGDIRKMLEKRIEERSRILANRKSFNMQEKQEKQHIRIDDGSRWEHSPSRKWETKDSIIHQIHADQ